MIQAGETFASPRTATRLEYRESTPQRVVFDRFYPPDTGRADAHVHFDISQRWEVLSGTGTVLVDGETREVRGGEVLEMETGVPHQDIHNASDEDLLVRWTVEPVNDFVEAFAECYTHYLTRGELNGQEEFRSLQIFPILHATKAQSWLAAMPVALQKALIPVGALLGRLRGYRSSYR